MLEKVTGATIPALYAGDERAARRTLEFFTAQIRNSNTRKAYARAAASFAAWCRTHGIEDLHQVQPVHVAAYIEGLSIAAPSIRVHLAALCCLTGW